MSSSLNSPCAACKLQRRKCTQECIFAPYFPPDEPQKFATVHKVYGASNIAKLLSELNVGVREDAVISLAYEAEARLQDPVYGCVGHIQLLQQRLKQIQTHVIAAKKELATYVGPCMMMHHQYNMGPVMGIPTGIVTGPCPSQGGAVGPELFEAQLQFSEESLGDGGGGGGGGCGGGDGREREGEGGDGGG